MSGSSLNSSLRVFELRPGVRVVPGLEQERDRGRVPEPHGLVLRRVGLDGIEKRPALGPMRVDAACADAGAVFDEQAGAGRAPELAGQQRDDEHDDVGIEDGGALQDPVGPFLRALRLGQAQQAAQFGHRDHRVPVDDRRRPGGPDQLAPVEGGERDEVGPHLVHVGFRPERDQARGRVDRARPVRRDEFDPRGEAREPRGGRWRLNVPGVQPGVAPAATLRSRRPA